MNTVMMDEVLAKFNQLPAMPDVVQEVICSFNDPKMTSSVLAHKISQDQAITARILRVANSSFYGLSRQVASVQDAVVILGFDSVRTLTIAAGAIHGLSHCANGLFDSKQFWQNSVQMAVYAKTMAKKLGQNQEIAFTAGLLQDIGQMVLAQCLPDAYGKLLARHAESDGSLAATEQAELGFDHAMLGAEVAKRWNFPVAIQHAIKFHHAPDQDAPLPITDIVHIANFLDDVFSHGSSEDEILHFFPEGARNRLECGPEKIRVYLPELRQLATCTGVLLEA